MRVLVTLRAPSSARAVRAKLAGLGARPEHTLRRLPALVVRVPRRDASTLVSRLARLPAVERVERDRVNMWIAAPAPKEERPADPLFGRQWGATLTGAPIAWAVTKGSPSTVVAVLDTGVDPSQPDLQGALLPGYDFVDDDADPSDDQGHGTAVAGVVAARAGNGLGGAGFCPGCSVLPVRVADSGGRASEADVAAGIVWAADRGARVLNLSLGGSYGATVADAVAYAVRKGALVVAAAGNNGNSTPFYPAASPGALGVTATQPDDRLYSWSSYGSWVAVAAPGCALTTMRAGLYGDFCGTSAATPAVSGLAGLAISFAPSASGDAIGRAITSGARRVGGVTYGRVDFAATLATLGASFEPAAGPTASSPAPAAAAASGGLARPGHAGSRALTRAVRSMLRHGSTASRRPRSLPVEIHPGEE